MVFGSKKDFLVLAVGGTGGGAGVGDRRDFRAAASWSMCVVPSIEDRSAVGARWSAERWWGGGRSDAGNHGFPFDRLLTFYPIASRGCQQAGG